MGDVTYQDKVVLKSERDETRKPSQFNFFYHDDDSLPWVEFLRSDNFNAIAATEEENVTFDSSDEQRQRDIVMKRCVKHCQEVVGLGKGEEVSLEWEFFSAVIPVLYPGDDVESRSKELRSLMIEWISVNREFMFRHQARPKTKKDNGIEEIPMTKYINMDWDKFLTFLFSSSAPLSPLFLQALAEVTNFRIHVITSAPGPYLLTLTPSSSDLGVKENGVVRLAHWNFCRWARLVDSEQEQTAFCVPKMEREVMEKVEGLLGELGGWGGLIGFDGGVEEGLRGWEGERRGGGGEGRRGLGFGYGGDYSLGTEEGSDQTTPQPIAPSPPLTVAEMYSSPLKKIVCGATHTLLLREDGSVFTMGTNKYGQLGFSPDVYVKLANNSEELKKMDVVDIASGEAHTLVATRDNGVVTFGRGGEGQLGSGKWDSGNLFCELRFPPRGVKVSQIACGKDHSAILTVNGDLYTFGDHRSGQLGIGFGERTVNTPRLVETLTKQVKRVACGSYHTLCTTFSGRIYAWGFGKEGRLGLNSVIIQQSPKAITALSGQNIVGVAAGEGHSLAVDSNGELWSWGRNNEYQLGLGDTIDRLLPTKITPPPPPSSTSSSPSSSYVFSEVVCGGYSSYAVSVCGKLFSWGDNRYGQLGLGGKEAGETPKRVGWGGEEGEVRVVGMSASGYHAGVVVAGGEDRRVKKSCKKTEEVVVGERGEGVFLLHDPVEVGIDVVFVGEDLGVWKGGKEGNDLWPRDWLSEDIGNARILAVELNNSSKPWKNYQESIKDSALSLLSLLSSSPLSVGEDYRPVVFVGSGVGGLVVKEMLIGAEKEKRTLFSSSRLVVFYSTPHLDESYANYSLQLSTKQPDSSFKEEDVALLEEGNASFERLHHIFTLSLGESDRNDDDNVFVLFEIQLPEAAKPNYKGDRHRFLCVKGDHSSISRPSSTASPGYKLLLDEIKTRLEI